MEIAFTICSNNYLARAKVVGETFCSHHPKSRFYIVLVDQFDESINYNLFKEFLVIHVSDIVPNIEELAKQYNIIELCTSVKASAFKYLFNLHNYETVTYLDPDLFIFDRFNEVEDALNNNNIVLTPHFCSPIDDGKYPSDSDFIQFGVFNLGYISVKNTAESHRFLNWWNDRLMKYCYDKPYSGMFTDQLWINYAPVFFEKCFILKHPGYNMANWNLFERKLTNKNDVLFVNGEHKLKFFHFSHFDYETENALSKSQNRYTLLDRPDLEGVYTNYRERLYENHHEELSKLESYYKMLNMALNKSTKHIQRETRISKLKHKVRKIIRLI